ncbi:hypothetical protein MUP77_04540 [Candidatus Bathyarchaeota archaeon]|nr:hypothetical protein [Candidatus Bathyarchaeota archaeon]
MAKYLVLWRRSPAVWPSDPKEKSNLIKTIGTSINNSIKKGEIKEHAHFLDGNSGYTIYEVEPIELFRNQSMLWPYYEFEVHEFIPYEKSSDILGEVFKIPPEKTKK